MATPFGDDDGDIRQGLALDQFIGRPFFRRSGGNCLYDRRRQRDARRRAGAETDVLGLQRRPHYFAGFLRDDICRQSRPCPSFGRSPGRHALRQHMERPLLSQCAPATGRFYPSLEGHQRRGTSGRHSPLWCYCRGGWHWRKRHRALSRRAVCGGKRPHPALSTRPRDAAADRAANRGAVRPAPDRRPSHAPVRDRLEGRAVRRSRLGDKFLSVSKSHTQFAGPQPMHREGDARRHVAL